MVKKRNLDDLRTAFLSEMDIANVAKYARRLMAVYLVAKGMRVEDVGEMFAVDSKPVGRWCARHKKKGVAGLQDMPRTGKRPTLDAAKWKLIIEAERQYRRTMKGPGSWGTASIAEYLQATFGITFSERQCQRIAHQLREKSRQQQATST